MPLPLRGNEEIAEVAAAVISTPQNLDFLQPIPAVVALQLFACAIERGYDIDQPRNLATSGTVEELSPVRLPLPLGEGRGTTFLFLDTARCGD